MVNNATPHHTQLANQLSNQTCAVNWLHNNTCGMKGLQETGHLNASLRHNASLIFKLVKDEGQKKRFYCCKKKKLQIRMSSSCCLPPAHFTKFCTLTAFTFTHRGCTTAVSSFFHLKVISLGGWRFPIEASVSRRFSGGGGCRIAFCSCLALFGRGRWKTAPQTPALLF